MGAVMMSGYMKNKTVEVPTRLGVLIENILNWFKTFQVIKVEEYSDKWFKHEMLKVNPRGTICEAHRRIYKMVNDIRLNRFKKREMLSELKRAYIFGQKMDNKLKEHKVFMND